MKSNIGSSKKFLTIMTIGIAVPQILLIAMILIKPLYVFLEDDMLLITISLFLIYYIVFSIIIGIRTYRTLKNFSNAVAQFIFSNFYQSLLFAVVMYLCATFLMSNNMGVNIIFVGYVALTIVSIFIFSITCYVLKRKNLFCKDDSQESDFVC